MIEALLRGLGRTVLILAGAAVILTMAALWLVGATLYVIARLIAR